MTVAPLREAPGKSRQARLPAPAVQPPAASASSNEKLPSMSESFASFASGAAVAALLAKETAMRKFALTLAAAALLAGCATEPFSYLDGRRYFRAELNSYNAAVVSVDGSDYLQNPVRIEPGHHTIVLQAPPVAGFRFGTKQTLELEVEPCKRYWFAAIRKNALSQEWTPRVDYVEAVAGCGEAKK
jgi:hypothetical protein